MARIDRRRARLRDVGVLTGIVSIVAGILFVVLLSPGGLLADDGDTGTLGDASHASTAVAAAPTADQAKGVKFEPFERVNPELPAIPAGAVKRFKVDVYEHVTKVSDELAPDRGLVLRDQRRRAPRHGGVGPDGGGGRRQGAHRPRQRLECSGCTCACRTRSTSTPRRSAPARRSRRSAPARSTASSSWPSTRASSCTTARRTRSCITPAREWSAR